MKNILIFLYIKWILRECPHICLFCRFRKVMKKECMKEIIEDYYPIFRRK